MPTATERSGVLAQASRRREIALESRKGELATEQAARALKARERELSANARRLAMVQALLLQYLIHTCICTPLYTPRGARWLLKQCRPPSPSSHWETSAVTCGCEQSRLVIHEAFGGGFSPPAVAKINRLARKAQRSGVA